MGYWEKIRELRQRRKKRERAKLKEFNRQNKYRIYFHVSNRYLYAQLFDDKNGKTLLTVTTACPPLKTGNCVKNKESAKKLAEHFAQTIREKGFLDERGYVFDRGAKLYHGRVQVFADTLREQGLKI